MTYEETLEYIHSICWRGSRPGLERISELCRLLGDPQKKLKFVHVAGTNGKGSTSAMLTSMLTEEGYKVGTFTSPYIFSFRERMCVGGEMISEDELARCTEIVRPYADSMDDPPTEFELICAVGFVYFLRAGCDIVVLEAGLGGRLDSTNIIDKSELSVITGIALDHTEFLGDTTEKIAAEKAGIIKSGCPVIVGRVDDGAREVIVSKAAEMGAPVYHTDYSKLVKKELSLSGATFDFDDMKDLRISLAGSYQPDNAALAITAAKVMGLKTESIINGLAKVKWRGRFEVLKNDPVVIFDGGHNIDGATAVANSLAALGEEKVILLSAVMADKCYREMSAILAPFCKAVYCVSPEDNPRALSPEDYAAVYAELGVESFGCGDVKKALDAAIERAKKENLPLLITGSLYLYGDIMKVIE